MLTHLQQEAAGNQYVHSERLWEIQKEISSLAHEYIVYTNIGDRLKNIWDIKKLEDILRDASPHMIAL